MNSELFVLQGVCAVIGTLLSKHFKGRDLAGLLLGLFLGPLGLLLIFAISDKRPKCPECRSALNAGARKCSKCGASILAQSVSG